MTKDERDTILALIPLAERALDDTASPFEGIEMTNIIENAREAIEQAYEDFQQVCWELYGDPADKGGDE